MADSNIKRVNLFYRCIPSRLVEGDEDVLDLAAKVLSFVGTSIKASCSRGFSVSPVVVVSKEYAIKDVTKQRTVLLGVGVV